MADITDPRVLWRLVGAFTGSIASALVRNADQAAVDATDPNIVNIPIPITQEALDLREALEQVCALARVTQEQAIASAMAHGGPNG